MNPIELAVPKRRAFFKINRKAFHAAAQKFLPVRAICKIRHQIKTYLDICVLRNEFNESFEAVQQVTGQTHHNLHNFVIFVSFFYLSPVVFKNNSNKLNNCN